MAIRGTPAFRRWPSSRWPLPEVGCSSKSLVTGAAGIATRTAGTKGRLSFSTSASGVGDCDLGNLAFRSKRQTKRMDDFFAAQAAGVSSAMR